MSKVQQILAVCVAAMSLIVGAGKDYTDKQQAVRDRQQHEDEESRQRRRDRDHIRQLERIVISEFPKWTAAIDWDEK